MPQFGAVLTPRRQNGFVSHQPGNVAFLCIWTALAAGFFIAGAFTYRHAEASAAVFKRFAASLYGQRIADRMYTPTHMKLSAVFFMIIGPIFVVIGITQLILVATHFGK